MPVYVTYHDAPAGPDRLPILGAQIGDRDTLTVGATAENAEPVAAARVARVYASEATCIQIGTDAVADAAKGEVWPEGKDDVRYLRPGERISVVAVA